MDKKDAIRAMLDGKKVQYQKQHSGFIFFHEVSGQFRDSQNSLFAMDFTDANSSWEIYEEFTYPMWFKNLQSLEVSKFISLHGVASENEVVIADCAHTDPTVWVKVDEPKTIIIEKWLYTDGERHWVFENSGYNPYPPSVQKLKLLDSYEVRL